MKRSLLKLMSLTLALLMVVSTFSGMIVFGVSAEDAVVEEPASEPAATAANTVENLFYPVMMHARPSDVRLEYGDGIEAEARGSGSSIPSDIVIRRIYQVAGRAFSVKAGDVIYYLAKDTNAYFYQYDAKGATITSSTGGEWAYPSNYTYTVTNHGSFGWIANYEWFLCSITVPEGTAYLAPSFTTDNATKHFITKNYQFTKEDYNAYWEAFDVDANTGITLDKDSNLAGKNILFLGDSTMSGANDIYAPTTGKGIAGRIALATGANVYNLALGESTSSSGIKDIGFVMGTGYTVADQFASRDTSVTYDAVVIWAGIHDARNQKSNGDETYPAFLSVVSSIETAYPNAKIFAISGPFRDTNYGGNGLQPGIHSRIKAWGDADASDNYYCIDIYSDTEVTEKLMYASAKYLPDAINPTSDAYDMITPYILDDMEAAFYVPEPLVNYYYPLMKHTNPSYTILEYGEGITANDRGTGSSIPTDIVRFREWQVSGRAFAVEPGDVIYFIEKEGIGDRFFKYDAEGKSLSTISGSGGYTNLVPTLEVTDHGYWGWIGSYGWNLFSVTIPEAAEGEAQIAYIAPGLTTDNMDRHFITKNQPFTKAEWEAYWAAFDKDANTGLTYDAESALNGKNILFMGDPTMYGINDYWAPSTGRGIPGRVALATGAKVTNIAKSDFVSSKAIENGFLSGGSGNTVADQFANREDKTTVYDAVVIWAGIHDARNERDNDAVLDAMKAVVADIEAAYPNAKIFVIGGPYRDTNYGGNGKQGGLHNRFSAWGAESETDNHYYIDLFSPEEIKTALNYASSEYLPDGINPTSDGYDILAPYVISAMEEAYAPAEPDETEPEETDPPETEPEETEPEEPALHLENLYYPLMKHTAPSYTILEYGEGLTANDRGTGSSIPTDIVRYREWQVSGRAFAVEAGDVLYFLAKSANDPFFKYDAEGNSLSTISGSGGYTSLVESLEVTNYGSFGWISNYEWFLCSVTIPEGVAFVAPAFTTDNLTKHFISKNRSFTRDEYNAYWAAFDVDANTGLTYDANSVLNGKKVLFMGDPTMYGINDYYAPTTGKGIAGRVALATGAVVTNIAASDFVSYKAPENGFLSGTTVAAQFEGRADTTTVYDAVVIWAGIHDGRYGLDNDDVLNAMKAVVADVEAAYPNVKIFVISGPYRDTNYGGNGKQGGQHQRFSAWGAESATDNHYYIDLYSPEEIKTALNYASAEYLPDGINPTSDGYDILAPYVISAMEEAYAHEHSVVFTDDSVKFDCAECADLKIKEIVKNEIADVRDGFEVIKLDANNFWFVTDAGFKNIVNGNVLTIGATTVLRVVDGALKAGSVKVADIADVDTFQIAVQIKNGGYVLYVNGDKVVSGAYIGEETITLGDEAFGARAKFLYNKAVTLGATDNAIVPSYKADKTNTECQHVGAAVNAALVNGKLVYDCGHCGERVYYATADTSVEAALANRTFDLRDKITVVELKTNKVDSVTAGDVVSIKRYGKDALVALSVDADGKLLTVGGTALTNKEGTAYSVLDSELDVVVVYDDENFKVRYYVEGYIAYANGVEAVLSVTETVASECGIAVNDAIVADYYCAAAKATEIFNYVGLQVHTESDMIRILSGIDAVWYDSVGYEVSVYDENGELVDVTKTVEGQTVYTSVGAAGEMVDASFYGYEFFAPLVINDIASASVGSTIVIRPFAKVGDISYKGGFVTISVTEEGYVAEKSVKFRVATANIGDFTGNNNPATDIAIQKATLEAVNADVFATQEDKAKLPDGLYPDYEYIARLGTGDYNYKAYLSNYKLGKTSKIYYDFDAAGLNDTINENPKVTLMDAISHGFFLYTTVEIEGYEIHLINVHVDWRSHEARIAQFKFILDFIDKNELEYVMVIGDMNPDDYTAYWDASSQTLKYRKNSGNSLHEEDLLLFTDRGEGKLNFKAANAGEFGTYHTILDHNGDPYQATRGAWDNILVSDNMVITNIEIIAEDWMNDHAFVAADIEIVK